MCQIFPPQDRGNARNSVQYFLVSTTRRSTIVFICFTNFILSSNTIFTRYKSDAAKISSSLTTQFYANFAKLNLSTERQLNKCGQTQRCPGSCIHFLFLHLFKIQVGDISKISCDPLCMTVRNAYISPVWPLNWHQNYWNVDAHHRDYLKSLKKNEGMPVPIFNATQKAQEHEKNLE